MAKRPRGESPGFVSSGPDQLAYTEKRRSRKIEKMLESVVEYLNPQSFTREEIVESFNELAPEGGKLSNTQNNFGLLTFESAMEKGLVEDNGDGTYHINEDWLGMRRQSELKKIEEEEG